MKARTKNFSFFILGVLFSLNILAWIAVYGLSKPQLLAVNFFDVGQGDAILIVSPQRHQILIDGGPGPAILEKLAAEMPFYDRSLDLIILTHPERDHISGLIEVLKRYEVENILWTGVVRNSSEYEEWIKLIKEEKAKIFIAKFGQKIICPGSHPEQKGEYMEILHPLENLEGREFENNSNDTSIVIKLVFNKETFLFTGDISSKIEKDLKLANLPLKADILKVAHHGSKYSSSDYFLESVLPEIAVIQVGKNSYGHPTEEALRRFEKFGIKILRTDLDGDIKIVSDGKNYEISYF
ncbi:MAG: MBL fold metallo-hydrolase [Candidatus Pacebacteria bacterium]|nr:MBL fold metallo-hydrolase [Candidatus Paceibacterota bacterium]